LTCEVARLAARLLRQDSESLQDIRPAQVAMRAALSAKLTAVAAGLSTHRFCQIFSYMPEHSKLFLNS